jgi:ankyrin repeat protein
MACSHMSNCELYVQFAADPSIEVWKSHFCAGDYKKCARYQRSLRGEVIPLTLLPNGKEILDNINTVDVGINVLFNAIQKDRLPMVKAIMKAKMGSGTIANSVGMTPLMYAASLGRAEIVRTFLTEGACNPHYTCNAGKTARDYAQEKGHSECVALLQTAMANTAPPKDTHAPTPGAAQEEHNSLLGRLFALLFSRNSKKAA